MYESVTVPEGAPTRGFYYHYKHDPAGPINKYAYEFLAIGIHTEEDCRPIDQLMANYRPLYDTALAFKKGRLNDNRPLSLFMEPIIKDGVEKPRFTRISDPDIIEELQRIRTEMYPEG